MNDYSVKLTLYPEQQKSIVNIVKKAIAAGLLTERRLTQTSFNAAKIQKAIENNLEFVLSTIVNKNSTDSLTTIAEYDFLCNAFLEYDFMWLLAMNTLTNRIVEACEKQKFYDGLVYRIRECAIAYSILCTYKLKW